jgi:hypothetical protein
MSDIPPVINAPAYITHDLPCLKCQYNLRTLSPDGRCPECGTPVAQTLAFQNVGDFRRLFRGTFLLWLLPAMKLAVVGLFVLAELSHSGDIAGGCIAVAIFGMPVLHSVLFIWAALLLFRAKPLQSRRPVARAVCLGYAAVPAVALLAHLVLLQVAPNLFQSRDNEWLMQVFSAAMLAYALCRVGVCIIAWRYFADLAARLRRRWLAHVTLGAMCFHVLISLVAGFFFANDVVTAMVRHRPRNWNWFGPDFEHWETILLLVLLYALVAELAVQIFLWTTFVVTIRRAGRSSVPQPSTVAH